MVTGWPLPAGVPGALGLPLSLRKVARQRRESGPKLFICRVSNCQDFLGTQGAARLQDFGISCLVSCRQTRSRFSSLAQSWANSDEEVTLILCHP